MVMVARGMRWGCGQGGIVYSDFLVLPSLLLIFTINSIFKNVEKSQLDAKKAVRSYHKTVSGGGAHPPPPPWLRACIYTPYLSLQTHIFTFILGLKIQVQSTKVYYCILRAIVVLCIFVHGQLQPTHIQLIQIYVDWTDVYETHIILNTEQNQVVIKVSADN